MGKKGAVGPGERSPPRPIGGEGDRAAQQSEGLSRTGLPGSGRSTAGGYQLGLRHLRRQASARGPVDTEQNVLPLFAHYQSPGEQYASPGRDFGEEHTSARLREAHGRQRAASGRFRQVRRSRRYGEYIARFRSQTVGVGSSHSVHGTLMIL